MICMTTNDWNNIIIYILSQYIIKEENVDYINIKAENNDFS